MAELARGLDVLHAHGLTAHGVVGHGEYHERHISLVLLQHFLQFLKRHVALEWNLKLCVVGLIDGYVDGLSLAALDVALGGVEVGVAGHHHAGLHQIGEEHVLGGASLMGGDDVLEAEDALHGGLKLIERGGTSITLVAKHELRPLAVAHGSCA